MIINSTVLILFEKCSPFIILLLKSQYIVPEGMKIRNLNTNLATSSWFKLVNEKKMKLFDKSPICHN